MTDTMSKFYKVNNLSQVLDGLIVEGRDCDFDCEAGVMVTRVINSNVFVGDRIATFPVPDDALFISMKYLQPVDDPTERQYGFDNPYGKVAQEIMIGPTDQDKVQVVITVGSRALGVTALDTTEQPFKTIFSHLFYDKHQIEIVEALCEQDLEPSDLLMELKVYVDDLRNTHLLENKESD